MRGHRGLHSPLDPSIVPLYPFLHFQEGSPIPLSPAPSPQEFFFSSLQGAELPRRKMQSPKGMTSSSERALQRKVFYSCLRGCFQEPPFVSSKAAKGGDLQAFRELTLQAAAAENPPSPGLSLPPQHPAVVQPFLHPSPAHLQGSTCSCSTCVRGGAEPPPAAAPELHLPVVHSASRKVVLKLCCFAFLFPFPFFFIFSFFSPLGNSQGTRKNCTANPCCKPSPSQRGTAAPLFPVPLDTLHPPSTSCPH